MKQKKPTCAVIYARYSSHNQTEQSIEGQLRDNYAWAKREKVSVIREYIDRALSGTKDARPEFQRMISDAEDGEFDTVIVWKLDRFARNRYDSAVYKARLKKLGVRVISVMENITDTPEGIIMEGLLEAMAEYYSANLSQNIKRGKRETMLKGLWSGGKVPYGYKVQDKRLVVNEDTAPAIRYLFKQYAEGYTKKEIIEDLNAKGYRTDSGHEIFYQSFSHTLRNTTYIGEFQYMGEVIEGLADQIIDRDTFERVQKRLEKNARRPASNKAIENYLFTGKIYCGECGRPMVGESGRGSKGKVYHYYACASKKKKNRYKDIKECDKKNEKKEVLEEYIVNQTLQYILTPDRTRRIAQAVSKELEKAFPDDVIKKLERQIEKLDTDTGKLIDLLMDAPKVAHQKIHERMETIGQRKADLEAELQRQKALCNLRLSEDEIFAWISSFRLEDTSEDRVKEKIIDTFINSVWAYHDRIVIFYNISKGEHVTIEELATTADQTAGVKSSDIVANSGA